MRIVVHYPDPYHRDWLSALRGEFPEAEIWVHQSDNSDAREPQADYAVIGGNCDTLFAQQRQLKAMFTLSAGVNAIICLPNFPRDVPLFRLEDAGMAEPMAQYVLAAALRFAWKFDVYAQQQCAALWQANDLPTLAHIPVGVLGLGAIGSHIANVLAAQGFSVRGFSRSTKQLPAVQSFAGAGEFGAFLNDLQILVSVLPLTSDNEGILDRSALTRLADGACVINVGRGGHIVDQDLITLLDEGKLGGATLDVFSEEPLPREHAFWRHPKIVVTPHVSGITPMPAAITQIAEKIRRAARGEILTGQVDLARGY